MPNYAEMIRNGKFTNPYRDDEEKTNYAKLLREGKMVNPYRNKPVEPIKAEEPVIENNKTFGEKFYDLGLKASELAIKGANKFNEITKPLQSVSEGMEDSLSFGLLPKVREKVQPEIYNQMQDAKNEYGKLNLTGNVIGYLPSGMGATKLAGKVLGKGVTTGVKGLMAQETLAGAGLGLTEGIVRGKNPNEILKDTATYGALGGLGAGAFSGIGKMYQGAKNLKNAYKNVDELFPDSLVGTSKDYNFNNINNPQQVVKNVINTEVPLNNQLRLPQGKPNLQNTINVPPTQIKPIIKPKSNSYSIKNTRLENAQANYNDAIQRIQNHFGTGNLRQSEIDRIMPELGIDIQKLADDLISAETTTLKPSSENARIKRASGQASDNQYNLLNDLQVNSNQIKQSQLPMEFNAPNVTQGSYKVDSKYKKEFPFREVRGSTVDDVVNSQNKVDLEDLNPNRTANMDIENGSSKTDIDSATMVLKDDFVVNTESGVVNAKTSQIKNGKGQTVSDVIEETNKTSPKVVDMGDDSMNELVENTIKDLDGVNSVGDANVVENAPKIKDKMGVFYDLKDVERNFEDIFRNIPETYNRVKEKVLNPLFQNKANYTDEVTKHVNDLESIVINKLGIKPNTKESKAIQWFGEGKKKVGNTKIIDPDTGKKIKVADTVDYTLENLKKEFPKTWKNIVEADKFFRSKYDEIIDKVNVTRQEIYPTNPDKLVGKRDDYYRHFNEISNDFQGLLNLFDSPANISPEMIPISAHTTPKSRWASFMQTRKNGDYTDDAIKGFLEYVKPSSYSIHVDKSIPQIRQLAKDIIDGTGATKNANNTIRYLTDFANDLSGKTSQWDRLARDKMGEKAFGVANWLTSRAKSNVVLGNIRSTLAQPLNLTNAVANIKNPVDWASGFQILKNDRNLLSKSPFLKERYLDDIFDKFDTKVIEQPKKFAKWMLTIGDKVSSELMWGSFYSKASRLNIDNPIAYADSMTRKMVAGRGIGEVPLLQKSKVFQAIAPFQLEVTNIWHVLKDLGRSKDVGGIMTLFLANHLYNEVYEKTTGSRIAMDPIEAVKDSYQNKDTNLTGRLAGEMLSNVPLGNNIADTFMSNEYTRKKFFGNSDPTRYGSGMLGVEAIKDPVSKLLPNWGGNQIKKTVEGAESLIKGNVTNKKITDSLNPWNLGSKAFDLESTTGEKVKYPVETTPLNILKGLTLGKYSVNEAKEYFDKERTSLSEDQTKRMLKSKDPVAYYEKVMKVRELEKAKKKAREERKSK